MKHTRRTSAAPFIVALASALLAGCDGGTPSVGQPGAEAATSEALGDQTVAWVMSYFGPDQDLPNDSLHLAYSTDGLHWTSLNGGQAVYQAPTTIQSIAGSGHIRDPFILRKNDGTFVYLATDWTLAVNDGNYWNHPSGRIFVADSKDLVTFTNPRFLTLATTLGTNTQPHAWAPEATYDSVRGQYAIVWSGNADRNRTYVSYTKDFVKLVNSTPQVLFDPGYDDIDATITQYNGRNYLFYKDETGTGKDIQVARSSGVALAPGTFTRISPNYLTRGNQQQVMQGTEGPLVLAVPGQRRWYLYADYYGNGGVFGCWTTTDLNADPATWTKLVSGTDFSLPAGVRHANTVRVTKAQLDTLKAQYRVTLLKTSYSEGGVPFYLAHSWSHGMITTLGDRSNGQLSGDFVWRAVPGLVNPADASLVSFESVTYPGHFLRIDSANPIRWPTGSSASAANRGYGLDWFAAAEKTDLLWLDASDGSAVFKGDATFRRVPGLNGSTGMVSLQWYADSTRYLRHANYQVLATPTVDAQQQTDASFTLEVQ